MNERIKQLAKQAGFGVRQNESEVYTSKLEHLPITEDVEKFAELLVKECVDIIQRESEKAIRNNTYMGDDVPASVTQWAIKKHFGVGE
jgi:hypothetical protein